MSLHIMHTLRESWHRHIRPCAATQAQQTGAPPSTLSSAVSQASSSGSGNANAIANAASQARRQPSFPNGASGEPLCAYPHYVCLALASGHREVIIS